jgi:hypothetical protein
MENKMRLSKAVKTAYQAATSNKLTSAVFVSDFMRIRAVNEEGYMDYERERLYRGMAEELKKKMTLTSTHRFMLEESGTEIRGECYVFTQTELLQLLDDLEHKVLKDSAPQTVWGD